MTKSKVDTVDNRLPTVADLSTTYMNIYEPHDDLVTSDVMSVQWQTMM